MADPARPWRWSSDDCCPISAGRRRPAAFLVGFDRGGWSPALFAHMDAQGLEVLTWRKGLRPAHDVDPTLFSAAYTDQ